MYVDMVSLRKAVFTNLRPDSVAWNHGSLRSFKPGFKSQPVLFSNETTHGVEFPRSLDIEWLARAANGWA